jgi:NAD(P)-dependent dehydrogenase (short-subunit alcohol dehydrogenase family)
MEAVELLFRFLSGRWWTRNAVPDLHNVTAVVTGFNSGMGYEITRTLLEHGAEVRGVCSVGGGAVWRWRVTRRAAWCVQHAGCCCCRAPPGRLPARQQLPCSAAQRRLHTRTPAAAVGSFIHA